VTTFASWRDRQTERTTRATDPDHGRPAFARCVKGSLGFLIAQPITTNSIPGRTPLRSLRVEGPSSSQASSLDTAQPRAHAHLSGLVVSGTVFPRTWRLQLVMRRSGVRFPEAALRSFGLTSVLFGRVLRRAARSGLAVLCAVWSAFGPHSVSGTPGRAGPQRRRGHRRKGPHRCLGSWRRRRARA
jgi:uncharacterized protein YjeT (DUF2065 family)